MSFFNIIGLNKFGNQHSTHDEPDIHTQLKIIGGKKLQGKRGLTTSLAGVRLTARKERSQHRSGRSEAYCKERKVSTQDRQTGGLANGTSSPENRHHCGHLAIICPKTTCNTILSKILSKFFEEFGGLRPYNSLGAIWQLDLGETRRRTGGRPYKRRLPNVKLRQQTGA